MQHTNINTLHTNKKVLVAPLDWGLGHATRCIPIINELLQNGLQVFIAAEKAQATLLSKEFPTIKIINLSGYNVFYSASKKWFAVKMLLQLPKIFFAIKKEHRWLNKIVNDYGIDVVISDNRYGLYNKKVKSIFITHQLQIQTGSTLLNKIVQLINYSSINKFNECWVPDLEDDNNLAGALSHPNNMPKINVKYIGILSRFYKKETVKDIDVAIVISGPEPQRTIFENIILSQISNTHLQIILSRGLPLATENIVIKNKNIRIFNHLCSTDLNNIIQSSKIVVARSGYSTIMDLAALKQAAVFVPTPGQTEQMYLATYLQSKKYCIAADQIGFDLFEAIKKLETSVLKDFPINNETLLKSTIANL